MPTGPNDADADGGVPGWVRSHPSVTSLGTLDVLAAARFYAAVVGWTFEFDQGRLLAQSGDIEVAWIERDPRDPGWRVAFTEPELEEGLLRAKTHGAVVLRGPESSANGDTAWLRDPSYVEYGLTASPRHRYRSCQNGTVRWVELVTEDQQIAGDFYAHTLGLIPRKVLVGDRAELYGALFDGRDPVAGRRRPEMLGAQPRWQVVVQVADVRAVIGATLRHGGTVIGGPLKLDGLGTLAHLADTAGHEFAVVRPVARPVYVAAP